MLPNIFRKAKVGVLTALVAGAALATTAWAGNHASGWQPAGSGPPLNIPCWSTAIKYECEPHGVCVDASAGRCTQKCIFNAWTGQLDQVACVMANGADW